MKYDPMKVYYYEQELKKKEAGKKYDPMLDTHGIPYMNNIKEEAVKEVQELNEKIVPEKPEKPVVKEEKVEKPYKQFPNGYADYDKGYLAGYKDGKASNKATLGKKLIIIAYLALLIFIFMGEIGQFIVNAYIQVVE